MYIMHAYLISLQLIIVVCSWLCCQTLAIEYGPSLASLTGVFVNWKGPDILALEAGRKVKLIQYSGYSTVIPLITTNSQATSEQIFQERGISTVGEFTVEAPPSYGVIAVIQELKLRKSTRDRGYNSSSCLDYIQFGEMSSGPGSVSGRICGTVHRDDMSLKPPGLVGPRTFMSPRGKLRMAFNHAYVSELVDALLQGGNPRKKAVLRVEVAFTAYKTNCSDEWVNGTSDDSTEMETFEACSDYTQLVNQTCISSKLLCDDVYNCGGDGETLGSDDQQTLCPDKPMRTTEKEPEEIESDQTERPGSFNSFLSMYGGTPYQYEPRKLPSYMSPLESSSTFQQRKSPHTLRKPNSSTSASIVTSGTGSNSKPQDSEVPSTATSDNIVRPVGSFSVSKSNSGDINESLPKRVDIIAHDDPSYGRRELADAINSVIYGVALFIVFTIFITLFVIYIGRRIQMNLSARNSRGSMAPVVAAAVTTPSIRPSTTTAVITRDNSSCSNPQTRRELAFSSSNTTVVLVTLPQQTQNGESNYDLPPSYDTLFPN